MQISNFIFSLSQILRQSMSSTTAPLATVNQCRPTTILEEIPLRNDIFISALQLLACEK